jgi:hypothetical protein
MAREAAGEQLKSAREQFDQVHALVLAKRALDQRYAMSW